MLPTVPRRHGGAYSAYRQDETPDIFRYGCFGNIFDVVLLLTKPLQHNVAFKWSSGCQPTFKAVILLTRSPFLSALTYINQSS